MYAGHFEQILIAHDRGLFVIHAQI